MAYLNGSVVDIRLQNRDGVLTGFECTQSQVNQKPREELGVSKLENKPIYCVLYFLLIDDRVG